MIFKYAIGSRGRNGQVKLHSRHVRLGPAIKVLAQVERFWKDIYGNVGLFHLDETGVLATEEVSRETIVG